MVRDKFVSDFQSIGHGPRQICLTFPVLFFYLSWTFRCLSSLSCLYRQQQEYVLRQAIKRWSSTSHVISPPKNEIATWTHVYRMVFSSNSQKWWGGLGVVGGVIRLFFQSNSNSQKLSLWCKKKIIVNLMKDLKYEHQSTFPLWGRLKLNFRDRYRKPNIYSKNSSCYQVFPSNSQKLSLWCKKKSLPTQMDLYDPHMVPYSIPSGYYNFPRSTNKIPFFDEISMVGGVMGVSPLPNLHNL